MKVLVLGATGMAGHLITVYLQAAGHQVTAFSRTPVNFCPNIVGDATDKELIKNIIAQNQFDAIINAIGVLHEEAEQNKAAAVMLNSFLPHYLSQLTKDLATRIIQISTDCVFSGDTGGYTEDALRDGPAFYDRSKALGELENGKDLTFRTSIVGPDLKIVGKGLFNWFMRQRSEIKGFTKAIWTGVTTLTLAKAIDQALAEKLTGLYHLVNNQPISKHDLLMLFNRYMRDKEVQIEPSEMVVVNKSLINTRKDFTFSVPSYELMVAEMKNWIESHRELYPHYFK